MLKLIILCSHVFTLDHALEVWIAQNPMAHVVVEAVHYNHLARRPTKLLLQPKVSDLKVVVDEHECMGLVGR